jgi:SAM-dependent methyltransferase
MNLQCPCCGDFAPKRIGSLQDSYWFAGKRLAQPLPGGTLYRCRRCLLKFRHPIAPPDTYRALYDNAETATWSGHTPRPDWDIIVSEITGLRPDGGRVLDFGCYTGGMLSLLESRYARFGVEINREAARLAGETTGACIWHGIDDIPGEERFDVIVLADVVEHLPDPRALLEALASRLADGGTILVSTGDANASLWNLFGANWWYCFYPEHIAFVSKAWVQCALVPRGWSLLNCRQFRYRRLMPVQGLIELALACLYGLFPRAYLYIASAVSSASGEVTGVPGNGVSADHILIALSWERPS